jgi:transcriptional regulator with XRE-family HTH domain
MPQKTFIGLPENIRKYRLAKNLSTSVMGERIGVAASTIKTYESGHRAPSIYTLLKISKLFNITIEELLGFAKGTYIDVTGLTLEQRSRIEEMISDCKELNQLRNLKE